MNYKVGDKIIGTINNVQEKGVYVTLSSNNEYGFMPNSLMPSLIDENGNCIKKKGDMLKVVVNKISTNDFITLSDAVYYEKVQDKLQKKIERQQQQQKTEEFAEIYKPGGIFEVEVIKINNYQITINLGGIEGIITKEETNWNEINQLENMFFVGEIINAVYLKYENNKLYFSTKYLNEKPYNDELYDLSLNELLMYTGHIHNIFIGQAKQYGDYIFIENLYSDSEKQKGKLLTDPVFGYNLRALVLNNEVQIHENQYYKIKIKLVPTELRKQRNQLFQFIATNVVESSNPYEVDVIRAFQRNTTNPAANQRDAKLLEEIGKNMYSFKDRMFFELVQNADDAASNNGVQIIVKTSGDYMIVRHNGYSFDKDDFEAITSAANGTKKANEKKTGYKGIGFKSVFTDSDQVYIMTGGYRFKFDKQEEIFQDFNRFYIDNNPMIRDEESKKEFFRLYDYQKNQFNGIQSIPWQLEPIWLNVLPYELGNDFEKSNVSIALKLGENKIAGNTGYHQTIDDIISNPKFMLFLRNTNRIDFNGKSVAKTVKANIITLKNSFKDERVEWFIKEDFDVEISDEAFIRSGIDIRIRRVFDELTSEVKEAKFVDLNDHELDNIPLKIAINNSTSISFAASLTEDVKLNPNTSRNEISLFAFLPTTVRDFRFPVYINANFVLDPPRQHILGDNPWNFYLMQHLAIKLVEWSAKLSVSEDMNSLNILMPDYFRFDTPDVRHLAEHFNIAYKNAIETKAFILTHKGELAKQEDILLDSTGLSAITGPSKFCEIIRTEKQLPSEKIDTSILHSTVFEKIEKIETDNLVLYLVDKQLLTEWYLNTTIEKKQELYNWLFNNNEYCTQIINALPIFNVDDRLVCRIEISNDTDYIITTEKTEPIKAILTKIGFKCTDGLLSQHPLKECLEAQKEQDIFKSILEKLAKHEAKLTAREKLQLVYSLASFDNIGVSAISTMKLFRNVKEEITPLCEMIAYMDNTPKWLYSYVLCQDENFPELTKYLIPSEKLFSDIVWTHFDNLGLSAIELYKEYKWTDSNYTKKLIDKYSNTDKIQDILSIVEDSDKETQRYYLTKLVNIKLSDGNLYKRESYESRVLHLALNVFEQPANLSSKIYFNDKPINTFSIKDEVICEYQVGTEYKKVRMSLSKLLPQYQNLSDQIEKIKDLFEIKKDLDKFFDAKSKLLSDVYLELSQYYLKTPNGIFPEWNVSGNAHQYLFLVYYRREKNKWYNTFVPKIDLSKENDAFNYELMNFLYQNNIGNDAPFTYWLKVYFINKSFNCEYISEEEKLLLSIENWADNEQKKKYLKDIGVRQENDNSILFRKCLINNEEIEFLNSLSDETIYTGLKFIAKASTVSKPYIGSNQRDVLLKLLSKDNTKLTSEYDFVELAKQSLEYQSEEYTVWKNTYNRHLFVYPSSMPKSIFFESTLLVNYNDENFCYDQTNKKIYINGKKKIEDLLFEIAKEGKCDFNLDDYQALCLKGKITISTNEIAAKEELIKDLKQQNQEKDNLLQKYRAKFGDINDDNIINNFVNNNSTTLSASQLEYNKSVITKPNLSQIEQIEAHKEAEQIIRKILIQDGYDCSLWNLDADKDEFTKWHSVNQVENIKSPMGDLINLVIKSAKGGYIYLSATDFGFLTSNSNNVLMVWDGKQVHSVTGEQIFNRDSNVNLIFDTEYTPKHYYAALSKVFQYVKRTTFAVKNPTYNAYNTIQTFGLDSKSEGVQELFDDNDL